MLRAETAYIGVFVAKGKGFADKAEGALVKGYGAIGGQEAAKDARAAWDASSAGHLIESLKLSLKADGDVIAHVLGHDRKPLETPTNQKAGPTKTIPSR
jgi:hypothetical protein